MIFSDAHRFAFVHIPKTAGMSVSAALAPYDSSPGQFAGLGEHPVLGRVDLRHVPLGVLRAHFPPAFEKLDRYESFTTVRDPVQRFPSSLKQRLQMYRGRDGASSLSALSPSDILREAYAVVEHLAVHHGVLAPDMIHFQPQSDFVFVDGRRVVDHVIPFEELALQFPALMRRRFGLDVALPRENATVRYRSRHIAEAVRAVRHSAGRYLPEAIRQSAAAALRPLRATGNPLVEVLAHRDDITAFICRYYAADIALHAGALRAQAA